jgi:hypothetical protein
MRISKSDKVFFALTNLLRVIFVVFAIYSLIKFNKIHLFFFSVGFILTFLPEISERIFRIKLPEEFKFIIVAFTFLAFFFGEAYAWYDKFWWWDWLLHGGSGFLIAPLAFFYLYSIFGKEAKKHPLFVFIFILFFGLAIGTLWEYFEFTVDKLFNGTMQKGLQDTMEDLLFDGLGALVIAILGYIWAKKNIGLNFFVQRFEANNQKK